MKTTKYLLIFINCLLSFVLANEKYEGDECELYDGGLGICTPFQKCQWAIDGLKKRKILYSEIAKTRCIFQRSVEVICCATDNNRNAPPLIRPVLPQKEIITVNSDEDIIVFPDKIYEFTNNSNKNHKNNNIDININNNNINNIPTRIGGRKIETACSSYVENRVGEIVLTFHILGGKQVAPGEFPHMVSLGYANENIVSKEYEFNCGGTIINQDYVLTAAHCISTRIELKIIRMGKISLLTNTDDNSNEIDHEISSIVKHPLYVTNRRYHDIALIRVKKRIVFNEFIQPACLRTNLSDIDSNVDLYATGWGVTSIEKLQKSITLLKTNVTSIPLQSCNETLLAYGRDRRLPNGVDLGHLCAFDPTAEHDSCEGDSGGPLQMVDEKGMSTVVGVTSFGVSCGSTLPSVYTRVAYYAEWIEQIAWSNT